MDDAVESYLTDLAKTEHEDPVLVEMEARAAENRFPTVGRATGRFLELAARAVGARSWSSGRDTDIPRTGSDGQ
jgi:predicted O-methyltransferase YrrM